MDNPFVSTDWLAAHLHDPRIAIVDSSWFLPTANRQPHEEYLAGHIPGAVFFDIDGIADTSSGLPHMLLGPDEFGRQVGALGIGDGMTIVLYDEAGLFSAPRVWWEFLAMGATDIRILEGGGPKWRAEGRPLEAGETRRPPAKFTAGSTPAWGAASPTCRRRSPAMDKSPTLGRAVASPAAIRNRGRDWSPDTCPAPPACRRPTSSPMARSGRSASSGRCSTRPVST
jgi:thiosulfate/3-mercaptopyruvate sulfurtransferase